MMADFYLLEKEAEVFDRDDILSSSQIKELELEEDLPEIQRAVILLNSELLVQKKAALNNIHTFLSNDDTENHLEILCSALRDILSDCSEENYELITEALIAITKLAYTTSSGECVPISEFPEWGIYVEETKEDEEACNERVDYVLSLDYVSSYLLPLIMDFIMEVEDKTLLDPAATAVIGLLSRLNVDVIMQVIQAVITLGDVSQSVQSRLACCRILGAIASTKLIPPSDIESLFLLKLLGLCQDTDSIIRVCMCEQLKSVARAVSEDTITKDILPELLELLNDEENQVKEGAFETMIYILDIIPTIERKAHVIPAIIELSNEIPEYLMNTLARNIGILMFKLQQVDEVQNETIGIFERIYRDLTKSLDPEIRRLSAYNFPGILKSVGASQYASALDDSLQQLSRDSDAQVRATIASGLHEVANMLGKQRVAKYLRETILDFLNDESGEIQSIIIAKLPLLIPYFASLDEEQRIPMLSPFIVAVAKHGYSIDPNNWRMQLQLIESVHNFPLWFSSSDIFDNLTPLLLRLLHQSAHPVQLAAGRTICWHARKLHSIGQRHFLMARLRSDFGHGRSYWQRALYLDLCIYVLEFNSRHYFILNYLERAMELLEDPVPNVRLKAISLLTIWKAALSFPADAKILDRINRAAINAQDDTDRDVASIARITKDKLANMDDSHTSLSGAPTSDDDLEDKRKMVEEEEMVLRHEAEVVDLKRIDTKWQEMLETCSFGWKDHPRKKSFDSSKVKPVREISRTSITSIKLDPPRPASLLKSTAIFIDSAAKNPSAKAAAAKSANSRTNPSGKQLPLAACRPSGYKMIAPIAKTSLDPKSAQPKPLSNKLLTPKETKEMVVTKFGPTSGAKTAAPPKAPSSPRGTSFISSSGAVNRARAQTFDAKKEYAKARITQMSKRA